MRIAELLVLYALVGVGCALAARRRGQGLIDIALALVLWPLWMPVLFAGAAGASVDDDERRFQDTLDALSGGPLASLLPDRATVRLLSKRLALAGERVREIDRLLLAPEFSEADARARLERFRAQGDERAAAAAQSRAQNIARMRQLRDRFAREIEEIRELLGQLRVQAEVVRLSGAADSGSRELVGTILARVDGLDSVLAEGAA